MKKLIIITNILISLALTSGSTTEFIQFNNIKDLMKIESFSYSIPKIENDEQITQPVFTVIAEKIAEKPEPIKEEETEKPEPVKEEDNSEKTEPVKKEEISEKTEPVKEEETQPQPEPVKEEPQPEQPQDTVASGNVINFNNNINKRGGVESLSPELQGYADQIIGVCLNEDEMTHCFDFPDLSIEDYEKVKQAINRTYFAYFENRIILYCFEQGQYYLSVNNSKERYDKSVEIENNVKNIVDNIVYSGMTEKEAITAINNYVCDLITYELNQGSPYVTFQSGKGNCRTYACIFKMLCNQVGIECDYIEGYGGSGYHAWNRVYIGGVGYWVDCCWNDDGSNRYFLSAELWDNHSVATVNQFFYYDEY